MEIFLHLKLLLDEHENLRFHIGEQYMRTNLPLTPEIHQSILNSNTGVTNGIITVKMLLSGLLAETGILGAFLYYLFLFKNIIHINKIKQHIFGIKYDFLIGLQYSFIATITISFYSAVSLKSYPNFMYGLVCAYISYCYYLQKSLKMRNIQNED